MKDPETPASTSSADPGDQGDRGTGEATPRRGATLLEALGATFVLVVLLSVFLWKPLSTGGAYAPSDLLQSSPLLNTVDDTVDQDFKFGNVLLTDPVLQMHPWLEWNKSQLLDGDLPVWNPYNGSGVPHFASLVSAVLSPFSAPFYLLPWEAALLTSAGLKLLVLGLFTYLFLRKLAASHLAGLVGAAGFMFAAYNVLWLSWPHPGAAVCLPAGLYFAEVAMQAEGRVRQRFAWFGYSLAVLVAILAGHPGTLFFSLGAVLVYVPMRLLASRELGGGRQRLAKAGQFVIATVLAAGLAGIQLLPFAEYLDRSTTYAEGSERAQAYFSPAYSGLYVFPNLFGAPSESHYEPIQLSGGRQTDEGAPLASNYNESSSPYVGSVVLLLAAVGTASLVRRRTFVGVFSVVAALAWVVYVHNLGGIGHAIGQLPLVELNIVNRSQAVWAFAACCLAAIGVDALRRAGAGRRPLAAAAAVGAAGTMLLAGGVVLARYTLEAAGNTDGMVVGAAAETYVNAHLRFVAFSFLAGIAAIAALVLLRRRGRLLQAAAGVAVLGVVFAQSGWLLRSHNPTIEDDLVYPTSQGIEAVTAAAGPAEQTVSLGQLLAADANLWYRIRTPDSYDGLGVRRYEALQDDIAALPAPLAEARALDVFGIGLVASEFAYPAALPGSAPPDGNTFTSTIDGLHALTVTVDDGAGGTDGSCSVTLELVDASSGEVAGLAESPCRRPFTTLSFPPVANSAGNTYTARFAGDGEVLALAPWASGAAGLEQVAGSERVALFRYAGGTGRYFSPGASRPVDDDEARRLLANPNFQVADTALVHAEVDETDGSPGQVEVIEEAPTRVRLEVTRDDPGWLVALQTHYPGWIATVDGVRVDLERANYTFTAVPVEAGTHEVLLRYRPVSVRYGFIVTLEAAVLMVVWLATARQRARRGRRERIPWDPTKEPGTPQQPGAPEQAGAPGG